MPISNWLKQPILPVVVTHSVEQGLQIAEGLMHGGIEQIELTLRTPTALATLEAIAKEFPSMSLSAGTILTPIQFDQAAASGATLFISPGLTPTLAEYASNKNLAWVPGVATASEVMYAMELGFHTLKFFPAMAAGGPQAVAGITGPIPQLKMIPTGGVTLHNLADWKKLKAVVAVGGTWLTSNLDEDPHVSQTVTARAKQALSAWHELH
jgi:2-dehydro-3-deoxyphosphogluconate aldolase/(4S)-4-hydroxy-2-oxoglutarate aldolase